MTATFLLRKALKEPVDLKKKQLFPISEETWYSIKLVCILLNILYGVVDSCYPFYVR